MACAHWSSLKCNNYAYKYFRASQQEISLLENSAQKCCVRFTILLAQFCHLNIVCIAERLSLQAGACILRLAVPSVSPWCTLSARQLHTTGLAVACSLVVFLKALGAVQDPCNTDVTHGKISVPHNARKRIEGCRQMRSAVVRSDSKLST